MIPILAVTLMVAANALYVAAEFSTVSARRTRLASLAASGNAAARALLPIVRSPQRLDNYVATCQIGITASSLVLGFYGQRALATRLEVLLARPGWLSEVAAAGVAATTVLVGLTVLQILLGELVPKSIAIRDPERLAMWSSYPMRVSERVFRPFIWLFNGAGTLILRLFGFRGPPSHAHLHAPEEIELLIAESSLAGAVDAGERQMLHNAFDLSNLVARQVMIPRNRLVLADVTSAAPDLLAEIARSPFSRIPVYRDTRDHILGVVHLKDLFRAEMAGSARVSALVRPVPVVPETLPVGQLWQLLHQEQTYLAVVIDEHGGTAGIVTQEDLLEEIIGEVRDEFDVEIEQIVHRAGRPPLIRGDVLVSDVNEALDLELPTDRSDTIGGLLVHALGRLAEYGDEVEIGGVSLTAAVVRRHWIEQVAVAAPQAGNDPQSGDAGG